MTCLDRFGSLFLVFRSIITAFGVFEDWRAGAAKLRMRSASSALAFASLYSDLKPSGHVGGFCSNFRIRAKSVLRGSQLALKHSIGSA